MLCRLLRKLTSSGATRHTPNHPNLVCPESPCHNGVLAPVYDYVMSFVDHVACIKHQLLLAHSEERARIREWLLRAYDDDGVSLHAAHDEDTTRFKLERLLRTNLRAPTVTWIPWTPPSGPRFKWVYAIASERDWLYVGFTANVRLRRNRHAATLRTGKHHNRFLQRHWNDHREAIWFAILETLDDGSSRNRHGDQHPSEIKWKHRLRPLYDGETAAHRSRHGRAH